MARVATSHLRSGEGTPSSQSWLDNRGMSLPVPPKPLWWRIATAAVVVGMLGSFLGSVLLLWPATGKDPQARVAAFSTSVTIAISIGGLATLGLVARKQWHHEVTDAAQHYDARERRLTEQYLVAVEQLGHAGAPVRIVGLHALDRIGQEHPEQRKVVADVWCGYLRRRFQPLAAADPADPASLDRAALDEEFEVRMTAQRLLLSHLRYAGTLDLESSLAPEAGDKYWDLEQLDLSGATLINVDFSNRVLPTLLAPGARFYGTTTLAATYAAGRLDLAGARFEGPVTVNDAVLADDLTLTDATFNGFTTWHRTRFRGIAKFDGVNATAACEFTGAQFGRSASFTKAVFANSVTFERAAAFFEASFASMIVDGNASFRSMLIRQRAIFSGAQFAGLADFDHAQFGHNISFAHAWFEGPTNFSTVHFDQRAVFAGAHFAATARFDEATFADSDGIYLNDARFTALASFRATRFRAGTDLTTADFGGQVDCADAQVLPPYDPDYPKPDPTAPPAGRWPRGWHPELLWVPEERDHYWILVRPDQEVS